MQRLWSPVLRFQEWKGINECWNVRKSIFSKSCSVSPHMDMFTQTSATVHRRDAMTTVVDLGKLDLRGYIT